MFHLRVEIQRGEDRRSSPLSAAYASATAYFPDIMSRDTRTTTKYVPDEGRLFKDTPKDTRALLLNEPPPPPPLSPPPLEKPFPREIITYYASRPRYVSFENFAGKERERERGKKEGRMTVGLLLAVSPNSFLRRPRAAGYPDSPVYESTRTRPPIL